MTNLKNWCTFAINLSIFLVAVINGSVVEIDNESQLTVLHPNEIYDLDHSVNLDLLTKENVNERIRYVLGARIAGDNLIAHRAQNNTWLTPQNASITLSYPATGQAGKQVTFVAIQVDQSVNVGQAYVVSGGLYQRNIAVVVEAYNTFFLNYDAQVYGV